MDTHSSLSTRWVETSGELDSMAASLLGRECLYFDTEFDSFRRRYGFTLLLMQVYDGETVWIVDPLRLTDLSPLWRVMEDPDILKVGYALGEDIRLLKSEGCRPRRLFDVQIARRLCNRAEAGLARALLEDLGIELDKSDQTSDWGRRPLTAGQLRYLADDVRHLSGLLGVNRMFEEDGFLREVFRDEMEALEAVEVVPREIELTRAQERRFGESCQQGLLGLMTVRDSIARELNVPHSYVVQTDRLEWIVEHRDAFLHNPFATGFHPKVRQNEAFRSRFLEAVRQLPGSCDPPGRAPRRSREESVALREARLDREEQIMLSFYLPAERELLRTYGEEVVKFLLRGMRKIMAHPQFTPDQLRPYQMRLYERFCTPGGGETGHG